MKINKIVRNKIFLSNEEIMDINLDIKTKYDLKEDMDIESLYDEISYEASLAKSLYLLSLRDRTEEELRVKLSEKVKNKKANEKAIMKIKELGYINDYEYALLYAKNSKYGEKRIEFELLKRGVSKSQIKEVLSNINKDSGDKLQKAMKKVKHKEENKIIQYLIRQGFELEEILEELKNNREEK